MFVGRALHTVNKDGRVSIPSKMREVLSEKYESDKLYIILMPGNIICLYPEKEFEKLTARLDNPQGAPLSQVMNTKREIFPNAEPCKLDGSGRIVIPPDMRSAAKIENEVLVAGLGSHIELWDPERWEWNRNQQGADKVMVWP